jgi:hypothetical protein
MAHSIYYPTENVLFSEGQKPDSRAFPQAHTEKRKGVVRDQEEDCIRHPRAAVA